MNKNSSKKILMVLYSYYPQDPRPRREIDALIQAGHQVDLICLREIGQAKKEKKLWVLTAIEGRILLYYFVPTMFKAWGVEWTSLQKNKSKYGPLNENLESLWSVDKPNLDQKLNDLISDVLKAK